MSKLDPANYGPRLLALCSAAYTTETSQHIKLNSHTPSDANALISYQKKHFTLGSILSYVPSETHNLILTPSDYSTPYDLLTRITAHPHTSNASDHEYLEQEA